MPKPTSKQARKNLVPNTYKVYYRTIANNLKNVGASFTKEKYHLDIPKNNLKEFQDSAESCEGGLFLETRSL